MRSLFVSILLTLTMPVYAQTGGNSSTSDTSGTARLRPRSMGSYVVGIYPSPAPENVPITVQTYNRITEVLSVSVYDNAGHDVLDLIPKQSVTGGLQTLTIQPYQLHSGAFHIQLTTYTASDVVDVVDDARFIIVH